MNVKRAAEMKNSIKSDVAKIILDTDIGNDIDDALALSVLHALQSQYECELLAVTVNKANVFAPRYVDIINTFYGRGGIPLGWIGDIGPTPNDGRFIRPICEKANDGIVVYKRSYKDDNYEDPVKLIRKILAAQPDRSVVIAAIGFLTNLSALLDSAGCEHSPLDGVDLVRKKVKFMSVMGGDFRPKALASSNKEYKEHNICMDIPSARKVLSNWPGKIVFTGFELGCKVIYPASSVLNDFEWAENHPVVDGYHLFLEMSYDRPCWDLISVLFAVMPDKNFFSVSQPGHLGLFEQGNLSFTPDASGNHFYLSVDDDQVKELQRLFINLCSQPVLTQV